MTSVPRIMARLVRPTPTWQLKRSAGSRRGSPLWPRDRLALSWRAEQRSVKEEQTGASTAVCFHHSVLEFFCRVTCLII